MTRFDIEHKGREEAGAHKDLVVPGDEPATEKAGAKTCSGQPQTQETTFIEKMMGMFLNARMQTTTSSARGERVVFLLPLGALGFIMNDGLHAYEHLLES